MVDRHGRCRVTVMSQDDRTNGTVDEARRLREQAAEARQQLRWIVQQLADERAARRRPPGAPLADSTTVKSDGSASA